MIRKSPFRRGLGALVLLALLAAHPPALRASDTPNEPAHRIGVVLAVVCGVSAKFAMAVPVPFAGLAVVSCTASFLDALATPD
jgi:hypothetical protein